MRILLCVAICMCLVACGQNPSRNGSDHLQSSLAQPADNSPEMINVRLGVGYFERGDIDTALEKLQKAIKISPKLAIAHSVLAVVYSSINAEADARRHYELSVKYAPNDPVVLNNYGSYLCQQGEFKQAVGYYERIVSNPFYKNPETAHENAGVCLMGDDRYQEAENHFRQALNINPELPTALYNMVIIKAGQREHLKARAFIQRLESLVALDEKMLTIAYQVETKLGAKESADAYRLRLKKATN